MDTKVYELEVNAYLFKTLNLNESSGHIARIIDSLLVKDDDYLKMHNDKCFKEYCFSNFNGAEKDYTFKEGNVYSFRIRTISLDLANYIKDNLRGSYTDEMQILGVKMKLVPKKYIEKIYSVTPTICRFKNSDYWRETYTISQVEEMIVVNLLRKYEQHTGIKLPSNTDIFNSIKIKNKRPIPTKYKNVYLLGDFMEFDMMKTSLAQDIAYFALGVGIGEINARGFGYANYSY